ncbi:MAG: LamG domain-containing protein [Cytophagaceae bacterium]|nr:MAG: LamG domain-containing protein [Cytophagaceae bacterium]
MDISNARTKLPRVKLFSPCPALLLAATLSLGLHSPSEAQPADSPTENNPVSVVVPNSAELMGWWSGDGDLTDNLGQNNGRAYGGVSYAPGKVGQAFHFGGDNSYIKVPTSDLNPGTGQGFTLEMWIKPDDLHQARPLAGWSATSTPGVCFWLESAGAGAPAKLGVDLRDSKGGSHRLLSDTAVIMPEKWQHVALTYRREAGIASIRISTPIHLYLRPNQAKERIINNSTNLHLNNRCKGILPIISFVNFAPALNRISITVPDDLFLAA